MTDPCFIGVDGCRGGWLGVAITPKGQWRTAIHSEFADLADDLGPWTLMLVDMPIGLPAATPRTCDRDARRLLGRGRASSVFPVPCRAAAEAPDYRQACLVNRSQLGVALSKQSWNILPKIRELDVWLRHAPAGRCRECHPELAFMALNRGRPLTAGKKTPAGLALRRDLLADRFADTEAVMENLRTRYPKAGFSTDDALDALVLAVSAAQGEALLRSLPARVETDACGLPMEIVFPQVQAD